MYNYEIFKSNALLIKPIGKLKRVSNLCDIPKLYIDESNVVFVIDFRTGTKTYMFNVYKEDGYNFTIKQNLIFDAPNREH
jgi:hypothetical protein